MKRMLSLALCFLLLLTTVASADTLTLPANLKTIEQEAFRGDTQLIEVIIPEGTESIGAGAFSESAVETIHIPDSVTAIDGDAFAGTDVTIVSSRDSFAHYFALTNGINWADANPVELEPLTLDNYEAYLLDHIDPILTEGFSDPEAIREIEAFNALIPEFNAQIDEYNKYLNDAVEGAQALKAYFGEAPVTETEDGIQISFGGNNYEITGDAVQLLDEGTEIVESQGDGPACLINSSGQLIYVTCDDQRMVLSQKESRMRFALAANAVKGDPIDDYLDRTNEDVINSFLETSNFLLQHYNIVSTAIDGLTVAVQNLPLIADKAVSLFRHFPYAKASQLYKLSDCAKAARTMTDTFLNVMSKSGISKALIGINVFAAAYTINADIHSLNKLLELGKHGHPTGGEMYNQALEICSQFNKYYTLARNFYIGDIICNGGSAACAFFPAAAVGGLILGGASIWTSNMAEKNFNKAKQYDGLLHWSVTGTVTDKDTKEALSQVVVNCHMGIYDDIQVMTDDNGIYYIEPISSSVNLDFLKYGYGSEENVSVTMAKDVPEVRNAELIKAVSGGIFGNVYDGNTGEPLAGATVSAGDASIDTNEEGYYSIELGKGTYDIIISKEGYIHQTIHDVTIRMDMEQIDGWLISEDTPGLVGGTVKDEYRETPIEGVEISGGGKEETTGSDGSFYMELAPGSYTLTFTHDDYETEPYDVDVGAGEFIPVDMTLKPRTFNTIMIYGRVFDKKTGEVLVGADVSCRSESRKTDEDGYYHIPVPVGVSRIEFSNAGYRPITLSVPVIEKESLLLDAQLCPLPTTQPETRLGDFEYRIVNGSIEITRFTGGKYDVLVPDTIGGLKVTRIGNCAFQYRNLSSVVIPEGVTYIGQQAFYDCLNLESVDIPSSVNTIEYQAFSGCKRLDNVVIPDRVRTIEYGTFDTCISLNNVVIPSSVTSIAESAFNNCALKNIVIPQSVASMSNRAFTGCLSLKTVYVPAQFAKKSYFNYATTINGTPVQ